MSVRERNTDTQASLLNDRAISRWYDSLKRGSRITADVYLRRLGHICSKLKLTPQQLIGMNESQLYEMMLDTVSNMFPLRAETCLLIQSDSLASAFKTIAGSAPKWERASRD